MSRRIILGLLLAFIASRAIAQATSEVSLAPEEFGSDITVHNVAPAAFNPRTASWSDCYQNYASWWQPNGPTFCPLAANFELPAGSLLISAEIFYSDTSATMTPILTFSRVDVLGNRTPFGIGTFPAGAPGNTSITINFPAGTTMDNLNNVYMIELGLPESTAFYRARLRYRRQVSPSPAVATFPNDVPTTHPQFRFVEALAAAGITSGCGTGSFCPDSPVTRGQMAVFLAAALGLHFPN